MESHGDAASEVRAEALRAGLAAFAAFHLGLALWMVIGPHSFYTAIGPFEAFNRHYIRDAATFNAALGAGFAVAFLRPSWRLPVIAVTTVQFALHTVNHLLDASSALGGWAGSFTGWFDFASLLAATVLLAWMWRVTAAARPRRGALPPAAVQSPPLPERSPT